MPRPMRIALTLALTTAAGLLPGVATSIAARPAATAPAAGRASAQSSAERDLTVEDLRGLAWRSVGPANMGGRVSAIALVPGSRRSFYVGYATGGIFKTDNLGVTFRPVFDKYGVQSIGALAVADAPADWPGWADDKPGAGETAEAAGPGGSGAAADKISGGKGKIVWVGTGEGNGRNSSSWGKGVYRSTDGGSTFKHLGLDESHDIPALAVDPRNPDVAYVAALGHLWGANPERGLYKTSDGGRTWQHVLKGDSDTGACEVALDPKSPDTVYAALYARRRTPWSFTGVNDKGGIFRSDDAGRSWKRITQGLPARLGRVGLSVYPRDPRIVYAVVESNVGGSGRTPFDDRSPSGGLFRSDDRGESWTRLSDLSFRPFYFSRVAVDPEDDKRVYLPGWHLAISDDGGRTFRRSGSPDVHVDFHAIVINPLDRDQILVGNDGGIYVSHDRAESWDYLNNVATGQFYRIGVDMGDPYRIGGGLQDNGSWMGPSETLTLSGGDSKSGIHNSDWRVIFGSDGFGVAFDPEDPNLVYATAQGGVLVRIRLDNNVIKLIHPSPREGEERLRFNWNAPFLISKHDPSVLYHGGNKVFKLTRRGDHWSAISGDLSRREPGKTDTVGSDAETYGTITALAESPLQQGTLWAGTDDGRAHVTTDEGRTWVDVTPPAGGGLYVSRLAASAHDPRAAYMSIDGHRSDVFKPLVLMTEDLGRRWVDITGDLPAGGPVEVVIEDPASPRVLYCGTEFGVFVSVERGRRWLPLSGKSLPPAPVDDIIVHPRERDLVVGTHGRSIYVLDDASMFAQLTPELRRRPLALLEILPARPRLYMDRENADSSGQGIFRAKNPPMGAYINYWLRDEGADAVSIAIADANGMTVREIEGTSRRGLNRAVWDLQADKKHRFGSPEEEFLGQTQFVPAGEYKVALTMGEQKAEGKVQVLPAPNAAP